MRAGSAARPKLGADDEQRGPRSLPLGSAAAAVASLSGKPGLSIADSMAATTRSSRASSRGLSFQKSVIASLWRAYFVGSSP